MRHQEEEIVQRLKENDVKCVKMIFDNHYQALCVFALRFLNSFEDAEDVVQDVLVDFWEKKKGSLFVGVLRSYFFGAVQKAALNHLRRSGHMVFEEIELHIGQFIEEISSEWDEEEMAARREKIFAEMQHLPEKCREVFIAIVMENMSYKETAEKLGISMNTVKTHYVRALKQLRGNLGTIILIILFSKKQMFYSSRLSND